MNAKELVDFRNVDYEWLCAQVKDRANDVTSDFEMDRPITDTDSIACTTNVKPTEHKLDKKMYVLLRALCSTSGIAIIKDTIMCTNGESISIITYESIIIDSINDIDGIFPSQDTFAISEISAASAILIPDIATVIWNLAREPVCTITFKVGKNVYFTSPVYSFPFEDFPKDPIPSLSCAHHSLRIKTQPVMQNFSMNIRNIAVKDIHMEYHTNIYLPGFDALSVDAIWLRGDDYRKYKKYSLCGYTT